MIISSKNSGFTLIELMITLLLSLLIAYGISQVLISSNKSSLTADGMSQSQETGRFAMSFLEKHIIKAGQPFISTTDNTSITTPAFISCTADNPDECIFEGVGGKTQANITDITNPPHGDRLAISFVTRTGDLQDCTGSTSYMEGAVSTPYQEKQIIVNTFWVQFDATSQMNSLYCQGHRFDGTTIVGSSSSQAIANGVEAMHILYGEASAALGSLSYRNVSKYVAADDVADWDRVYAVKVSVMTRSITDATSSNSIRNYVLLDAAAYAMTDSINRQVFTTTWAIPNYNYK
jgi:type IV pilus assembly protein PilW